MTLPLVLGHVAFAFLLFLCLPLGRLSCRARGLLLTLALCASLITINGLSMGDYVRSYAGDLAIVTLLWMGYLGAVRVVGRPLVPREHKWQLALVLAAMGLILFPATLGLSYVDPYRLGYSARPMLAVVLAVCLLFVYLRNYLAVAVLALATLAYAVDVKTSDNYWDYLIDPIVWIMSLVHVARRAPEQLVARWRRTERPRRDAFAES